VLSAVSSVTLAVAIIFSLIFKFSVLHALAIGVHHRHHGSFRRSGRIHLEARLRRQGFGEHHPWPTAASSTAFDSLLFAAPAMYVYLMLVI
jgi:phosphatidate cytidylyltransferase